MAVKLVEPSVTETTTPQTESQEENAVNPQKSDRFTEPSTREILVTALEGTAKTELEQKVISEYIETIPKLNEQEAKLNVLNAQIREISFGKGPRDTAKLSKLKTEAAKTRNRINIVVRARSVNRPAGSSWYKAAEQFFDTTYGEVTRFTVNQLGLSAEATHVFLRESLSKVGDNRDKQTLLDLIPHLKTLVDGSRVLSVEKVHHNDTNKKTLLFYRLYNAYIREESNLVNGATQTQRVPHIVVFNVAQEPNNAKAQMVTDIKDVAISNGRTSTTLQNSVHANGNISINRVADVYAIVKRIDRKKGGLRYDLHDRASYAFDYTHTDDGQQYSDRLTEPSTTSTDITEEMRQRGEKAIATATAQREAKVAAEQKTHRAIRAALTKQHLRTRPFCRPR